MASQSPRDLQDEVERHASEALRMKQLFNTHSPAINLPPEIISIIFLEQARLYYQQGLAEWPGADYARCMDDSLHKELYGWTAVARVCRRWREVALLCPQLWTYIILDERVSPRFVRMIIQRSQGLPLTVVFHGLQEQHCRGCAHQHSDDAEYNHESNVMILEEVLDRARHLTFFIESRDRSEVLLSLDMAHSAHHLESLRIEGVGDAKDIFFAVPNRAVTLLNRPCPSPPPALRSLTLVSAQFEWQNVFICSTLRHLKVTDSTVPPSSHRTIYDALRNMPQLEELDLDLDPIPAVLHDSIPLPSLRHLSFVVRTADSLTILSNLRLPPSTTVEFVGTGKDPRSVSEFVESASGAITPVIGIRDAVVALLQSLKIYALVYRSTNFSRGSYSLCRLWAASDPQLAIGVPQSWRALASIPPRLAIRAPLEGCLMSSILRAVDLQQLRMVSLTSGGVDYREPLEALRRAENVQALRVRDNLGLGIGSFLAGWRRPPRQAGSAERYWPSWYGYGDAAGENEETDVNRSPPLFPKLKTLEISNVDFPISAAGLDKDGREYWFGSQRAFSNHREEYGFDVKSLVRLLRERPLRGMSEVLRVSFENCQCYERERLTSLVSVVPELWWDGERVTEQDILHTSSV